MLPTWIGPRISGFLSWWGEELAGLLPGSPSPSDARAGMVIAVEPNGLRLIETTGAKSQPRPDGVGIGLREIAIAAPFAGARKLNSSGQTSG